MALILLAYSSVDGHTRRICERLGGLVQAAGHAVTLMPIEQAGPADLEAHDKVVIGASIRYGRHRPNLIAFANEHAARLEGRPNAFFTVNIVARKPDKSQPATNPYLRQFLRQVRWRPAELEVFAGKLDYPRYRFFDRLMIRFIMLLTRGPTDPRTTVEFTDWRRVETFAQRIAAM